MSRRRKPSEIHVLELSAYESPVIKEEANKDFVSYGEDNNFYQEIIDRFVGSTTNHSVINGIVNQIYGKGLDASNSSKKPNEYAQMRSIFGSADLRKVIQDLKLLGEGAFQIVYKGDKISKAYHFPRQTLRAEKCNDKGEIEAYLYHPNWSEHKPNDKLKRIPTFNNGKSGENEILIVRKYVTGFHYYSLPDYCASLPYALLEEEIANYLINDTMNGFSGTSIVNFANGIPDEEKRENIKSNVLNKLTGSGGDKVIVSFNPDKDSATTIENIALNNAPEHYSYLSTECATKIMVGHRVTSPLLLGIRSEGGGLGSNADEIKNAQLLFTNLVIKPYQDLMIDAIDDVLAKNGIALNLYFKTLNPLEFMDVDVDQMDDETKEEETGVKEEFADQHPELSDENAEELLSSLQGEIIDADQWVLADAREHNDNNSSIEDWAKDHVKEKRNLLSRIVKSKPSGESYLDKSVYKVRYKYVSKYSAKPTGRAFCKAMMQRTAKGVVYRIEDIDKASREGINRKFGHKQRAYDIFKYKGSVNCSHVWQEQLYRLKKKTDGSYYEDKALSSSEQVKSIPKSYKPTPSGRKEAIIPPIDMDYGGHHPDWIRENVNPNYKKKR